VAPVGSLVSGVACSFVLPPWVVSLWSPGAVGPGLSCVLLFLLFGGMDGAVVEEREGRERREEEEEGGEGKEEEKRLSFCF
jgi:hypothetical protein